MHLDVTKLDLVSDADACSSCLVVSETNENAVIFVSDNDTSLLPNFLCSYIADL